MPLTFASTIPLPLFNVVVAVVVVIVVAAAVAGNYEC